MPRFEVNFSGQWHHFGELTLQELREMQTRYEQKTGARRPWTSFQWPYEDAVMTMEAVAAIWRHCGVPQADIDEFFEKVPSSSMFADEIARFNTDAPDLRDDVPTEWMDSIPLSLRTALKHLTTSSSTSPVGTDGPLTLSDASPSETSTSSASPTSTATRAEKRKRSVEDLKLP